MIMHACLNSIIRTKWKAVKLLLVLIQVWWLQDNIVFSRLCTTFCKFKDYVLYLCFWRKMILILYRIEETIVLAVRIHVYGKKQPSFLRLESWCDLLILAYELASPWAVYSEPTRFDRKIESQYFWSLIIEQFEWDFVTR